MLRVCYAHLSLDGNALVACTNKSSEKEKPHTAPCVPIGSHCLPHFVPFQYLTVYANVFVMVFTGSAGIWDLSFFFCSENCCAWL